MAGDGVDLTDLERAFVASLSAFAGGFSLDAARTVSAPVLLGMNDEFLESLVADLLRRAVLVEAGPPTRYDLSDGVRRRILDTSEPAEIDEWRSLHLDWARSFAERCSAGLDGPAQAALLDALDAETENLTAALDWGTSRPGCEPALGLAAALGRFWEVRGHTRQGREWLDRALTTNPEAPPAVRANAANSAALLAFRDGDYETARAIYDESLLLHWDLDDRLGASAALHALGNIAFQQRQWEEARRLFGESLSIGRDLRDDRVIAASLTNLGAIAEVARAHAEAGALYEEAVALWRALGDSFNSAAVLGNMADIAVLEHDWPAARRLATEALEARRLVGDRRGAAALLGRLAFVAGKQRDTDAARAFEAERRQLEADIGDSWGARLKRRFSS